MIRVENLCKEYVTYRRGSRMRDTVKSLFHREKVWIQAVKDISFSIEKGEIVGILGPNGTGKSTTIKMLTGVLTPTAGKIEVMGYVPYKQRTRYVSHIGAVFGQKSQLIWDIPPMDSFQMNRAIYDIPAGEYQEMLHKLVALLDAEEVITRPTRVLSLGERMKCEFIMAMLHRPDIVFLDEPTIGLDVIAKDNIRTFIRTMNQEGTTFVLTTHDLSDVEQLTNRVIVIDKGEKVYENTLLELRKHLGNRKMVKITVKNPMKGPSLEREGISLSGGGCEWELSVDNDTLPMDQFIGWLHSRCDILDISIKEPSMEEIIKTIYLA